MTASVFTMVLYSTSSTSFQDTLLRLSVGILRARETLSRRQAAAARGFEQARRTRRR